ncbi:hypothetical protein NEHOM01_1460 [Nematocida homosporus]|uniref:uncharacterized protein n=1 Tax=Nematocida homosporus TaxID=1912981 RepID=UPI0022201D93|nr:uncharacterized protein NEHOM01_1460 [Nematocida homosporus]KAI5186427.1 hypothetical protein NEHOM01_1460 [Nematocida homosporus]
MGTTTSTRTGPSLQIVRVAKESPAGRAGVLPIFHYVIGITGVPVSSEHDISRISEAWTSLGQVNLTIYDARTKDTFEIRLNKSNDQPNEKIGFSIKIQTRTMAPATFRILDIAYNSSALDARLQKEQDYIIGSDEGAFTDYNEFAGFIWRNRGGSVRLWVYNTGTATIRLVELSPTEEGSLRCEVGDGYFNEVPHTDAQVTLVDALESTPTSSNKSDKDEVDKIDKSGEISDKNEDGINLLSSMPIAEVDSIANIDTISLVPTTNSTQSNLMEREELEQKLLESLNEEESHFDRSAADTTTTQSNSLSNNSTNSLSTNSTTSEAEIDDLRRLSQMEISSGSQASDFPSATNPAVFLAETSEDIPMTISSTPSLTNLSLSHSHSTPSLSQSKTKYQLNSSEYLSESLSQPNSVLSQSESLSQPNSVLSQSESLSQPNSVLSQSESKSQPNPILSESQPTPSQSQPNSSLTPPEIEEIEEMEDASHLFQDQYVPFILHPTDEQSDDRETHFQTDFIPQPHK